MGHVVHFAGRTGVCGSFSAALKPCYPVLYPALPLSLGFPGTSDGKESTCNVGDRGSTPGLGRSTKEGIETHSKILAWKIPWTEDPGRLQSMGSLRVNTTERLHFYFSLSCIGEGNGNPLQCSCLENPKDGGTWWAAVSGFAQSDTTEAT